MKRLTLSVLSVAALLVLTLSPALALTNCDGCCGQPCCGQACCHTQK